ncbi:hypothetical protein AB6864_24605 [Serratia proteamaculans]|uniref:hypothetical protein n=1 Tax=Serratia proteamaculans TaxID=28151 RepID=UPI0028E87586|nr:hypothetical protein [Serratia proteamaculans]
MGNKLSELSKPSAEVVSKFGDPEAFGERELKVLADIQKLAYGTKFYSQEYVSALLAELEAKDKRIAAQDDHINQQQDRIESLEKKNGELGKALGAAEKQLVYSKDAIATWERKAISNFDECANMSQRIAELEQRLATPVRLPDIRSDDYHETGWFQHMKYYRDVEQSLRAAGLAVGDE